MAPSYPAADLSYPASASPILETSNSPYPRNSTFSHDSNTSTNRPFSSIGALFAASYDSCEDEIDPLPTSATGMTKHWPRGQTVSRSPIPVIQEKERGGYEPGVDRAVVRQGSKIPDTPMRTVNGSQSAAGSVLTENPKSGRTKDSYARQLADPSAVGQPSQRQAIDKSGNLESLPPYTPDPTFTPASSRGPRYPAPTRPTPLSSHRPYTGNSTIFSLPITPAMSHGTHLTPNTASTSLDHPFSQSDSPSSWSACPSSASSAYTPLTPTFFPHLPPPHTPISPYLAAPSPAMVHPGLNRSSGSSDSIKGLEVMLEKKALFRGGEEELISPFSPRSMLGIQLGLPDVSAKRCDRLGGTRRMTVLFSGTGVEGKREVDFWKRMSTSVRLEQVARNSKEGESEWLVRERRKNRVVKYGILSAVFAIALIVAAVRGVQMFGTRTSSTSTSSTSSPAK